MDTIRWFGHGEFIATGNYLGFKTYKHSSNSQHAGATCGKNMAMFEVKAVLRKRTMVQ
jgi:hypothetical protein